jgi:catechol-2,3-dioxygenase
MTMHIGHVALRVVDIARSHRLLDEVLGLRERRRTDDELFLTANEKHHELQLIRGTEPGLDHIGLEVESADELEAVVERAVAAGASVIDSEPEPGLGRAARFVGPAGIVYEVYEGMERDGLTIDSFLKPMIRRLGHLTLQCEEHDAVVAFWVDGLGFRITDTAEGHSWLRCDTDHHGLAVAEVPGRNAIHHYAWEVQDWGALGQFCDEIARSGHTLMWGPVRHGPGFNLAAYLGDADGAVIEVYADLLQVDDEASYRPIDWSEEPRALNLWGPGPEEELMTAGVPILQPATIRP